jgi:hypothetical protein
MRRLAPFSRVALPFVAASICAIGSTGYASATTTPRCATSALVVWLNTQDDHAAGSSYYTLEFTNLSGHACTLQGFPGISAVDLANHQLGSAAQRTQTGTPRQVRLASNGAAAAVLQVANAHNFPRSTCRPVVAAGLRVYPPNETASKVVPFPFPACSRAGPVYLLVRPIRRA